MSELGLGFGLKGARGKGAGGWGLGPGDPRAALNK